MTLLFLGDIVGRLGRQTVRKLLPNLKKEHAADFVFANAENLAGGRGVTKETLDEMLQAGIDYFTSGNHVFHIEGWEEILEDNSYRLLRPANYPPDLPGKGLVVLTDNSGRKAALINLSGRGLMIGVVQDPFRAIDDLLSDLSKDEACLPVVIDLHAELTSEKNAFGFYVDGRVSAVIGTHTHIPTADAKILPQGTGFVTDAGMVGALNSVLGVKAQKIIEKQKFPYPVRFEWVRSGPARFDSVLVQIDPGTTQCRAIQRLDQIIP